MFSTHARRSLLKFWRAGANCSGDPTANANATAAEHLDDRQVSLFGVASDGWKSRHISPSPKTSEAKTRHCAGGHRSSHQAARRLIRREGGRTRSSEKGKRVVGPATRSHIVFHQSSAKKRRRSLFSGAWAFGPRPHYTVMQPSVQGRGTDPLISRSFPHCSLTLASCLGSDAVSAPTYAVRTVRIGSSQASALNPKTTRPLTESIRTCPSLVALACPRCLFVHEFSRCLAVFGSLGCDRLQSYLVFGALHTVPNSQTPTLSNSLRLSLCKYPL
ncbi:hypothetical protein LZ30DRAFT_461843 [Colletotrichum cereale]|nr:hypothetical protein LZ30DRAFT_461843 [Colletotrichum cereale]